MTHYYKKWRVLLVFLVFGLWGLNLPLGAVEESVQSETPKVLRGGWFTWDPYQYIVEDQTTKTLTGFDIELARMFAGQVGYKLEYQQASWTEDLKKLQEGSLDFLMGGTYSDERSQFAYFSIPYRYEEESLFVLRERLHQFRFNTVDDMLNYFRLQEKQALLEQNVFDEKAAHRLSHLEEVIGHCGGYSADSFARQLLLGLGLQENQHDGLMSNLSGGYKLRVLLAQALFEQPDILLLDEPTNHLDIASIIWLENYLKTEFSGLLIFISHDQDLLNHLSTHILDIDYGELTEYVGNYEHFVKEKVGVLERKMHEKNYMEKKVQKLKTFIERFRASASRSKQALSREKMLDKLELPEIKQSSRIAPNFHFQQKRPSGKHVLKVEKVSKSFGEKQVLHNIGFSVGRGEKLAVLGRNGIGKSTLLKILTQNLEPSLGEFEWGIECHVSYFAQDHHEALHDQRKVIDWLSDTVTEVSSTEIRKVLGSVLFSHDEVYKGIDIISGGEAARLLLAKMMLERNNILILDEPTNHLDLETRNALSHALKQFPGTVIFVSHDRHFVNDLATRILILSEKGAKDYHGGYDEYVTRYGFDYLIRSEART